MNLLGVDFDYLVTGDDSQTAKSARRYCYNNKWHDRVKKTSGDLAGFLGKEGGILVHFGADLLADVDAALFSGVPVVIFPENFKETLERVWKP